MVSWWVRDSYFNHEKTKICDIEIMNAWFCSSGSFGSRFRYRCIFNNTYTVIRVKFISKPTSIHGPVHKSELNFSYSIIHFSRLPQTVYKVLINFLSQKVIYYYMIIDPVIN